MRQNYQKLYEILSPRDRRAVVLLFILMLLSAIMETVGIASILPLIAVLSNPEIVQENAYLRSVFDFFEFEDARSFLIFLGLSFFALFIVGLLMRTVAFWAQARFSNSRMHSLSSRIFFGYLSKNYEWFLDQHSSKLATTILSEVDRTINQALFPSLQIVAHAMVVTLLLSLLVVVDWFLALSAVIVLGGSYIVIYLSVHRNVSKIGAVMFSANRGRYKTTNEALGGIKDLKMKGMEVSFLRRFQRDTGLFAKSRVQEQLIGQIPGYAMQGVIFGGMLLIILYLMTIHEDFGEALPILAMYAIAGYRMMPSLQNGYRHLVTLRNASHVLNSLHADFVSIGEKGLDSRDVVEPKPLRLESNIRLNAVRYRYPSAEADALSGISLTIPRYSTVAFVGPTGCGKTTTVDTILGLLRPSGGSISVDDVEISSQNVRDWQRNIGYVPQDIYLADASIAANIAYGQPQDRIDRAAVEQAGRIANLHEFVSNELPDSYDTVVGERGVRLSGGQKQRIGIARALYYDPEVLVLDEATSALDNLTEQAVMEAVRSLATRKTIIMIAHRLSTVEACDTIFLLESGKIAASGSYRELVESNEFFRRMAGEEANTGA